MFNKLVVREATEADIDAIVMPVEEWLPGLAPRELRAEMVEAAIRNGLHELLVAELGGEVAGFLLWAIIYDPVEGAPIGYVQGLYVRIERRSMGIGTALLRAAIERARKGALSSSTLASSPRTRGPFASTSELAS